MSIPQRGVVNAPKADLTAGKFEFMEIAPRRGSVVTDTDMTVDKTEDEIGNLQVKLRSEKGRFFSMSLRQFFSLALAPTAMSNEDVAKEVTGNETSEKISPLYNSMLDAEGDEVEFPKHIEFVYCEDRTNAAGGPVYPPAMYDEFQERV